jgi:predicted ArsR family transcriptional regulator
VNPELDARLDRIAALGEPVRRELYRHVAARPEPVSRDEAARVLGVARHVAKFHLDRLVDEGLLAAEYRRPPGRSGPGAGRPAKLYRAVGDLAVSLPERHYDLAGRLLVRAVAVATQTGSPIAETLDQVAGEAGRSLVTEQSSIGRPVDTFACVTDLLDRCGYESNVDGDRVELTNCPFHDLAEENRDLVCGMNVAFVRGILDAAPDVEASAHLEPAPPRCCVVVTRGTDASAG